MLRDYANDHRLYSNAGQTFIVFNHEDGREATYNIVFKQRYMNNMPESTIMDMELCADFIVNRTGIDKETVKQVLKTETDYWMELDPSY